MYVCICSIYLLRIHYRKIEISFMSLNDLDEKDNLNWKL